MLGRLTVILALTAARAQTETEVEIEEYWGDFMVEQGKLQRIRCLVTGPVEGGEFSWTLGDKELPTAGRARDSREGGLRQAVELLPELQHDGKVLACRYGVPGGRVYSDQLKLEVYQLDLPPTVQVDPVEAGQAATLSVTAAVFPAPNVEDVVWRVAGPAGVTITDLNPEGSDPFAAYYATNITKVDGQKNSYKFSLEIAVVDMEEINNTHTLTITTGSRSRIQKKTTFTLALNQVESEDGVRDLGEEKPVDDNTESGSEKDGKVRTSSTPVILILVLVAALVILCTAAACCYRRRQQTRTSDSKTYTAVSVQQGPGVPEKV